ncbi:hypothetical protein WA026_003607 [Henosepilachna vigintioctopunctata]|uniref:Uncharacterized protein n=1 Tax=Henosepilachna vigintioctopunctata TaxID=420089 RepID=A0AAW1TNH8_9CUCU
MNRDDDDGVGFVAESHYLKSPSIAQQQAMALLQVPRRDDRASSVSSNISDLDVPIYSSDNLTTRVPTRRLSGVIKAQFLSCFVESIHFIKKYKSYPMDSEHIKGLEVREDLVNSDNTSSSTGPKNEWVRYKTVKVIPLNSFITNLC